MKKITEKILALILAIICALGTLVSCDNDNDDDKDDGYGDDSDSGFVAVKPSEEYDVGEPVYSMGDTEEDYFINLFSPDVLVEIDIDISDEQLLLLQQDFEKYSAKGSKSPIYRMADVTIKFTLPNGTVKEQTIEEVGVRMKGNTSRTNFYSSDDGIYNLLHLKLDFGETFDDEEYYGESAKVWSSKAERKARKNRTFATLEKLDLRWNKEDDATYIREMYSYDTYREMGVLAPHVNLTSLDMAGTHMGVYTVNEPVDSVFLEKNLSSSLLGGDLYKCGWGNDGCADFRSANSIGVEDEDNGLFYAYDLKTNKKTSDHESLKSFITALNSKNVTKEKIAELVDIDYFLNFAAVSWFLGNPDDLRNNYNNFYIYFPPEGGALLIPYDYDRSMGISHDWNPSGNGMTEDNPLTEFTSTGNRQKNPLYIYTVIKGGYYTEEYLQRLSALASGNLFSNARFSARYEKAKSLLGDYTAPSKQFGNNGGHHNYFDISITADPSEVEGNISYSDYVTLKLKTLNRRLASTEENEASGCYYVRATFTNWEMRDKYLLTTAGKNTYTFTFTQSGESRLKIYDSVRDEWLGGENVDKEKSSSFEIEKNGNIILSGGTYVLTFYSDTRIIVIERK